MTEIAMNETGNPEGEINAEESVDTRPSWKRLMSPKILIMTTFFIFTTIIIIVLAVTSYIVIVKSQEPVGSRNTCRTSGCINTASKVLENMDREIDPCDNFYRFACENFIRNGKVPEIGINELFKVKDKVRSQIREILQEPINPEEPKPFVLVKNLYKACMNTSLIESRGIEPFLKILDSVGGWPVLKGRNWDEDEFSWQKSIIEFKKIGFSFNHIIHMQIGFDRRNSSKRSIRVGDVILGSRATLIKGIRDSSVIAYYNYMVDIAMLLGAPKKRALAELRESLLFEISLANITSPIEKRIYPTQLPHHFTIAELQIIYSIVNWREYINALLPPGLRVDEGEVISEETNCHLREIEQLLRQTPKRVVANYLMWKTTSENIDLLTEDFRKREAKFDEKTSETPRLEYCTELVKERLFYAVNSLLAREHFNADAKSVFVEMVNRIKTEVTKILKKVNWMDKETRKLALKKIKDLHCDVGYPDELQDVNKLEEYYKDVQIDESKFMESLLSMKSFYTNNYLSKFRKPLNKTDYKTIRDVELVTAHYSAIDNSINFPPGLLQGMFFSADRPHYMNYGAIGFVIGHEIIHGFNHQGRLFDMALSLGDWWTTATKNAYFKKANCIIEQYESYKVTEVNLNLNAILTLGEDIADNAGIKAAYLAYTKWVEENEEEPQLPGLNYTAKQMFWLSTANSWCSKYTPEVIKSFIEEDHHSPAEFRIIGSFSNSEDFAKDFQCPLGSPMNPKRKCKVF